jgi:hypothetical protein
VPRAIAEAPQAVWYVRPPSGGQFGPADSTIFYQWMKENRVAREALVWRDGWPQWMIAGEAFEEYYGPQWLADAAAAGADKPEPSGSVAAAFGAAGSSAAGLEPVIATVLADVTVSPASLAPTEVPLGAGALPSRPHHRRRRRRTNYALGIGLLAVLAIALVVVLVTVLMAQ